MKIAYCLNSIRYLGGIQMVTIKKANALAEVDGNEVYVIVTDNRCGRITADISPKVRVIDLDVNYYEDDWKSKYHLLKGMFVKKRLHKKCLRQIVNEIQPDIVVSVGTSEKYMLPSVVVGGVVVREMHFVKNYRQLAASSFWGKIIACCGDLYDFKYYIKKYDQIVVLTQEDKELNWNNYNRVSVIPNPLTLKKGNASRLNTKKIIAVGRLSVQKNFSSLISVFRFVVNKHPDWVLEIYGEGDQREKLQDLIEQLELTNNVYLKGYTSQVREKMLDASCFVMSSKFEGLPLVLLEAVQCGLPCVSYACPCGPKDIITDGEDGFLVSPGDEETFAEKICFLIEHPDKRIEMGQRALQKAEKFSIENIVPMWMELFNKLVDTKKHYEK